ncbi:hypothetical protein ACFLIM_35955 [Nonomuraea sp. M3C6]|uniref:Uncharacterized protein n=1 Tax=Nonomuraea marmarensis TaxID=3351344 RepID=A0ABW7AR57_9ACTN
MLLLVAGALLARLPQHTVRLPIACVEGWSVECEWSGVRLRDLINQADGSPEAFLTGRVPRAERLLPQH